MLPFLCVNVYLDKITLLTSIVKELEETESLLKKTCINLQNTIESYNGIINTVTDDFYIGSASRSFNERFKVEPERVLENSPILLTPSI